MPRKLDAIGIDPPLIGVNNQSSKPKVADLSRMYRLLSKIVRGLEPVAHIFKQPPEGWGGVVGFVTQDMIETHCPAPASDEKMLRCDPPPMNKAMAAHLEGLGYASEK